MEIFLSNLIGFFSGILGAMGMGGGSVLIIFLVLFQNIEQTQAQGINLVFFIPIAILSTIIYAKKGLIKWKITIPCAIFGIIGALLGSYFINFLEGQILRKCFGVLLLIMAFLQFKEDFKHKKSNTIK